MGKVLGGGSSINAIAWARGHKNDRDFFASEAEMSQLVHFDIAHNPR
jgi:hypothetical protein